MLLKHTKHVWLRPPCVAVHLCLLFSHLLLFTTGATKMATSEQVTADSNVASSSNWQNSGKKHLLLMSTVEIWHKLNKEAHIPVNLLNTPVPPPVCQLDLRFHQTQAQEKCLESMLFYAFVLFSEQNWCITGQKLQRFFSTHQENFHKPYFFFHNTLWQQFLRNLHNVSHILSHRGTGGCIIVKNPAWPRKTVMHNTTWRSNNQEKIRHLF